MMSRLRVLRVYHAAQVDAARDQALLRADIDLTLVTPDRWPGRLESLAGVHVVTLPVRRAGDVNRHVYAHASDLRQVLDEVHPDVLDLHEEPVSLATRQWLRAASHVPVVMYTAQNIDKRWPPPFARYERAALRRTAAFYPCSRQAASVIRGKGYEGAISVLRLGVDRSLHFPGEQALPAQPLVLGTVGRLVPEKGVQDAVRVLAAVAAAGEARLVVVGVGPEAEPARRLAGALGVADLCQWVPWLDQASLARVYRDMHVVLVPSSSSSRWVEQFGRVIVEAQANGAVPVAYDSGAICEALGDAGVLVAEADVKGLSDAVVSLVADPTGWRALRADGLRKVVGWEDVAERQVQLYREAVQGTRRCATPGRQAALAEFGPSADTPAGRRPLALPVLRDVRWPHRT